MPAEAATPQPSPRVRGGSARRDRGRPARPRAARWASSTRRIAVPAWLKGALGALWFVSPLGWAVAALAVACAIVGTALDWTEFGYAAAFFTILLALSCLLTFGRTRLEVRLRVHPTRVTSGEVAVAEVRVRNLGKAPLFPVPLELPCGDTSIRFLVPALPPDQDHDELVVLPTDRRGVYEIGPVTTLRGDPLGLIRRAMTWGERSALFVYPKIVGLRGFTTGVLRDLDGQATADVSQSDLAFHAIREYAPGDDFRHIHWATTAKRSSASGAADLMVRQFLDTRRTHIGVVLDTHEESYDTADEFELAVQIAASISSRAITDAIDLSQACWPHLLPATGGQRARNIYARAEWGPASPMAGATALARAAPNISVAVIVTGSAADADVITRTAAAFPAGTASITVRTKPGVHLQRQRAAGRILLWVGSLADLPRALTSGGAP